MEIVLGMLLFWSSLTIFESSVKRSTERLRHNVVITAKLDRISISQGVMVSRNIFADGWIRNAQRLAFVFMDAAVRE